jgi:hypothetical protein
VRLASTGDLSTRDEVLDVYLAAFGDHPEVSEDFVYNLTLRLRIPLKLLLRPLSRIIRRSKMS